MAGLAILNDGKYAYSSERNALDVTLVRSPYFANHEPFRVEAGMDYPTVDWGRQEFTLALLPHAGAFYDGGMEEAAMLLNAPPTILAESAHDGTLAAVGSLISLEARHAVIDAVKMSQDGQGDLILHLHETARLEEDAVLRIPLWGVEHPFRLNPGQIRAFRIAPDGTVTETNLIEDA